MANRGSSANRFFPPSDDFGRPGSGFEPPYFTGKRRGGKSVDNLCGSELMTSNNSEEDDYENVGTGRTGPYNYRGTRDPTATFGVDYSKFYEAFRQGITTSQTGQPPPTATPTQRPAAKSKSASRRKISTNRAMLPNSARKASPLAPSKRSAPSIMEASKRIKLDSPANSDLANVQTATPKGVACVVERGHATKMKGSGVYTRGNWAWISDEEDGGKVDEKILAEARQIAAFAEASAEAPVKMTRRQLQELKSKINGASPATTPIPGQWPSTGSTQANTGNAVRPSRRVSRVAPNYSESNPIEDGDDEPTLTTKQRTPSTLDSAISHDSTPAPGQATRSTSASTVPHQSEPNSDKLIRPKMSWNAIVYEVFANSTIPEMTLSEVQQGVKDRFPFFGLPENLKTLESSPRNPLYMHPSFYKTQRADGKIAWGLKPGEFLDKKTGKVLNARPNHAIRSIESTEPSVKAAQPDLAQTPSTPRLHTPPASDGEAEADRSPSNDKQPSKDSASERSLHKIANGEDEVSHDKDQDEERLSGALSRNSPQEVPETQLPRSSPQEMVETQLPNNSPQEVIETQLPSNSPQEGIETHLSTVEQPPAPTVPQSRERRRLEGIVHTNLTETFEAKEMELFLLQTKLWYFRNIVLTQEKIAHILNDVFPIRYSRSTDAELAACARDLQAEYQNRVWASDWFQKFVKDNVTQFDEMNVGFLTYTDLTKPKRLNFWLARSIWNRDTCKRIFSALSDAVDVDRVWNTKHWRDFVEKIYATACDATRELRGQDHVFREIKAALDERYSERDCPAWNVPTIQSAYAKLAGRKPFVITSIPTAYPGHPPA